MIFRGTIELLQGSNSTTVYADRKPISRQEFVAAGQIGIRPMWMFEVRTAEYADEKRLKYENTVYTIYRVYPKPNGITELYCEVRLGAN